MTQSGPQKHCGQQDEPNSENKSMKTKLSDIASVAEIVGAIAVILSLIYVGIQVNENASAVRSASANDANTAMQNWYLEVGSSQQTSELF